MASSSSLTSRLEKDLEFLLSHVTCALDEAETNAVPSNSDKLDIKELREIVYDAEDALQDYQTKKLQDKIEGAGRSSCETCRNKKRSLEVRDRIPSSPPPPVPCFSCTEAKLRKLEKDAGSVRQRASLSLEKESRNHIKNVAARRPLTGYMITPSNLYSMEGVKEKLVNFLSLTSKAREKYIHDDFKGASCKNLTILPIVGTGRSGKTTLAQHVYNDERIEKLFKTRAWVCTSHHQNDNPVEIMNSVLEFFPEAGYSRKLSELSPVQEQLKVKLAGKTFLLVIDDAGKKSRDFWSMLCAPMAEAVAEGSAVIITTSNYEVIDALPSHIQRTTNCYPSILSFEDCMSLFKSEFSSGELEDDDILTIAEQIVRKYEGIPGAIKDAAKDLRSETDAGKWREVLARASRDSYWVTSYCTLGPQLRRCFLFCALFPKGYPFTRKYLINLLMSEGFVIPKKNKRIEDIAGEYFTDLEHKFVLLPRRDNDSEYVMPIPLHDIAEKILDHNFCRLNDKDKWTQFEQKEHLRYASFIVHEPKEEVTFKMPDPRLRTYLLINNTESLVRIELPDDVFTNLGYLRTLDLSYTNLAKLPDTIGHLRSLHFLGLNGTLIKVLPESLCTLYNLQTLELNSCKKLQALPKSISKLVHLRHLRLDANLTSFCMPVGFGKLTDLQTLPIFNVGRRHDEDAGLQELGKLENLQGKLLIRGLCNAKDLQSSILGNFKFLRDLTLCWSKYWNGSEMQHSSSYESHEEANDKQLEQVFKNLKPHSNLQCLQVKFYDGKKLPEWMQDQSFKKLKFILLRECKNCDTLPSLGVLPSLRRLAINNVGVDVIDNRFGTFPSLEELTFDEMYSWRNWSDVEEKSFPRLEFIHLSNCTLLERVPRLEHLKELKMDNCGSVLEIPDINSLEKLEILSCKELRMISSLTSLKNLKMDNCPLLERVPRLEHLKELKMDNCGSVLEIPDINSLEKLEILSCKELRMISSLTSLKNLKMDNCGKLTRLPSFPCLEELVLKNSMDLMEISHLPSLEELIVENCGGLTKLPSFPLIKKLEMLNCTKLMEIPSLPSLETLKMDSCGSVVRIPDFPCLEMLEIRGCKDLIEFPSLAPLQIPDSREVDKLHAFSVPPTLEVLILRSCTASIKWDKWCESNNGNSPKLEFVEFFNCLDFGCVPKISSVRLLKLEKCQKIIDLSCFPALECLHICDCDELRELPTIGSLSSLTLMYCGRIERICDQPKLQSLWLESCNQLPHISQMKGVEIGMLPSLESLFAANSVINVKPHQAWLRSKNFVQEKHITIFTKDGKV